MKIPGIAKALIITTAYVTFNTYTFLVEYFHLYVCLMNVQTAKGNIFILAPMGYLFYFYFETK